MEGYVVDAVDDDTDEVKDENRNNLQTVLTTLSSLSKAHKCYTGFVLKTKENIPIDLIKQAAKNGNDVSISFENNEYVTRVGVK